MNLAAVCYFSLTVLILVVISQTANFVIIFFTADGCFLQEKFWIC